MTTRNRYQRSCLPVVCVRYLYEITNFSVSRVTVLMVFVLGAHWSDIFKFEVRWGAIGPVNPLALAASSATKALEE